MITMMWESRPLPKLPDGRDSFWECRPLPKLPALESGDTRADLIWQALSLGYPSVLHVEQAMCAVEMEFHLTALTHASASLQHVVVTDCRTLAASLEAFQHSSAQLLLGAALHCAHWSPFVVAKFEDGLHCFVEAGDLSLAFHNHGKLHLVSRCIRPHCGAATIALFRRILGRTCEHPDNVLHQMLQREFLQSQSVLTCQPVFGWGFGPSGQLLKNLSTELLKHGIPATVVEQRAADAIRALGSEQVATALAHRQPWKQLKILGNNVKFQFVLPSELATAIEENKGQPVSGKGKGKSKTKTTNISTMLPDPTKLQILDGTFCALGQPLHQLNLNQLGPLSSGVVLISSKDAEPYLRTGQQVSQEPLAMVVLSSQGSDVTTALPHAKVTIPCRCTVDREPVLVDGTLVQIGQGMVEKKTSQAVVHIDTLDVVTLKVLVYKDEIRGDWSEFTASPIRHLVSLLPMLKRCTVENCTCDSWHNVEKLEV